MTTQQNKMHIVKRGLQAIANMLDPGDPLSSTINVHGYKINMFQQIGQGGFGTVYKAMSPDGQKVAAKFLSSCATRSKSTAEEVIKFHKITRKNHENIVRMLRTEYQAESGGVWIMMEFCHFGDLDNYFKLYPDIDMDCKLNLMIQIMNGLSFLHRHDIVHRDIKPGNVLIQKKPNGDAEVRLADFGLSKLLDPDGQTSSMNSDVGTLYFKAPEFFKEAADGKIHYHRNVDVFAAGLTFLAMIQHRAGHNLCPAVEKSLKLSVEGGMPIGLMIRNRQMSKPPQASVTLVVVSPEDDVKTVTVKTLIEHMTWTEPTGRPSSHQVLKSLHHLASKELVVERHNRWTVPVTNAIVLHNSDRMVIRRAEQDGPDTLRAFLQLVDKTGDVLAEVPDVCPHRDPSLAQLRNQSTNTYVAHACLLCRLVYVYNMEQQSFYDAFPVEGVGEEDVNPVVLQYVAHQLAVCTGPVGSVFYSLGSICRVKQLTWQESNAELMHSKTQVLNVRYGRSMCYVEESDVLVATQMDGSLTAVSPSTDQIMWKLPSNFLGQEIQARCMATDALGNLLLVDEATLPVDHAAGGGVKANSSQVRLFQINSLTGNVEFVTTELATKHKYIIRAIGCFQSSPNLMVYYQHRDPSSPGGTNLARHKIIFHDLSWKNI